MKDTKLSLKKNKTGVKREKHLQHVSQTKDYYLENMRTLCKGVSKR